MRKRISGLLWAVVSGVVLLSGVSCEKMIVGDDGDDDANVVVSIRSIEQTPFASFTRTPIEDVCTRISFVIIDKSGEKVDQINQELGDEAFGQGKFTLPIGDYRLAIVAHSSKGNPTFKKRTNSKNESLSFTNPNGFTDTFFASRNLTVGEDAVDLSVDLTRIAALIRFINYDQIPVKADSIKIEYKGGSGTFDALSGWGNTDSNQYKGMGKSNFSSPFEIYTIPRLDSDHLNVTVITYQGTDLLTETMINEIPIKRNCITTCRGCIFDGKVSKATFEITINDNWGTPIDYTIPSD